MWICFDAEKYQSFLRQWGVHTKTLDEMKQTLDETTSMNELTMALSDGHPQTTPEGSSSWI